MTSFESEADFIKVQIDNHKAALAHFKKARNSYIVDQPLDMLGEKELIESLYLDIEAMIKTATKNLRQKLTQISRE